MQRALVVVDDTDRHRELLREAGELAAGVGADLVLLSAMTQEEYEQDIETISTIAEVENIGYGQETIMQVAEQFAESIADEEFEGIDVAYEVVGTVVESDERAREIVRIAESRNCDHVFITGRRRSPVGKAIFGDTAQSVILNFDGAVTITAVTG